MVDSSDFAQVLAEAEDIAQSVSQKLTSAHLLLALFTVENRAQLLLKERNIDEDQLLNVMTGAPREADGITRELGHRAREIARQCGSLETDCLHLLIATTRVRCLAQDLLVKVGLDLTQLRNTALSYFLSGRMPRKLQLGKAVTVSVSKTTIPVAPSSGPAGFQARQSQPAPSLPQPQPQSRPITSPAVPAVHMPKAAPSLMPAPMPAPALKSAPAASPQYTLDPGTFPLLNSLGKNLTRLAVEGALDPVIGRGKEIEEVIDILGKRRTNNPCLVGEPGVGKTAVAEGVAQKLLTLGGTLAQKIIVELEMANLVAGTQLRGSFSEKLNGLKEEVKQSAGRVIVFIDELHTLVGAGATGEGPQDAANELKNAMSRGEFPCIGATTHDEFRKHVASDPALERRFTPVVVKEPSVPETVEILKGIISRYEQHHRLKYSKEALQVAASLAARYVSDRFLPDKAISIVDLAGSRCARELKDTVLPADVARIVAQLVGMPEERLLMSDASRLLKLENELSHRVIGHQAPIERICQVVRRNYAGFASRRPMGSFLFLGPSGVGKTELARALAEVLFGNRDSLIQLDMSEMAEGHGVARLIGSPAGYVGYGEGGQLTEPVRRRPSSVVLFDEIEKAHRDVWMLLLQVLEEGRLTDGKGRHIDFSNTVVVLTSNLGAELFSAKNGRSLGFGGLGRAAASASASAVRVDQIHEAAKKVLPIELWNRLDERLVFNPLDRSEVSKIAWLLLHESSQRLSTEKGIAYVANDEVIEHLLDQGGFDPRMGARPMRQTVQRLVEAPLAEKIILGEFASGDRVRVALDAGKLRFSRDYSN